MVLALREVLGKKAAEVHWDHTPKGMSIDRDVVIGKDADNPETVVFVTHASAERAGEKKFWRTVAEAIEAKRLSSHPKILTVLFPGNVKGALKDIYKTLFDGHLHLDEEAYGKDLADELAALTTKHGTKPKDVCLAKLEDAIAAGDVPSFKKLSKDVKSMLAAGMGSKHAVMASSSFVGTPRLPAKSRVTSLRRSVCKLYTLPNAVRDALLTGKPIPSLPPHALLLGWMSEDMAGDIELVDDELNTFLKTARRLDVKHLCGVADRTQPSFKQYAETLRAIGETKYCNEWILKNFASLGTQRGMAKALYAVFADPVKPLKTVTCNAVTLNNHWLFQTLMAMQRAETGRADGYGYAGLSADTGIVDGITGGYILVADFASRKTALSPHLLKTISATFAGHLTRLGATRVEALLKQAVLGQAEAIFNFQMMNYRNYNPIDWLVAARFEKEKIAHKLPANHDSFLSASGGAVASRTGNLISVDGGRVWIKCQSGYDGRIDKRKELCGRIGAMKLCYSTKQVKSKRFLLVIDGFFDDEDIRLFGQAGWDGVFYYDELDDLVAALAP